MVNFDNYTNENKIEHNLKWLYIPNHPYPIIIVGDSGSGKTNELLIKYIYMQKIHMKLNMKNFQ